MNGGEQERSFLLLTHKNFRAYDGTNTMKRAENFPRMTSQQACIELNRILVMETSDVCFYRL